MLTPEFPLKVALLACSMTAIISLFNRVSLLTMSVRLITAFISFYIIGTAVRRLMAFELREKSGSAPSGLDEAEDNTESADDEFMEYKPPVMQATEKQYPGRR